MIDLKKPLEGIPGLLLMVALVLFGAAIGVTAALALSWVEMKDSIANFLGGVVGAGLGAALAVSGAVYVQRRERRERLARPLNTLRASLGPVYLLNQDIRRVVERIASVDEPVQSIRTQVKWLVEAGRETIEEIPDAAELPFRIYQLVYQIKRQPTYYLDQLERIASPEYAGESIRALKFGIFQNLDSVNQMVSTALAEVDALVFRDET